MLAQIQRDMGAYNFASQYQQRPAPRDGGMVKRAWLKCYAEAERPEKFDLILQSWDTANKVSDSSDFTVCTTWGIAGPKIYLLHVYRKKLNYPDLKRAVGEQANLWSPEIILIEDRGSGAQLIQELIEEGVYSVKPYSPSGMDKETRMNAQTAVIENGFVYLPSAAEWLDLYLHEMTLFPAGRHDDQVDSTAQALHWLKTCRGRKPGIVTYLDQELRKMGKVVSDISPFDVRSIE